MAYEKKHSVNKGFFGRAFRATVEIFVITFFVIFTVSFFESFHARYNEVNSDLFNPGFSYERPTTLGDVVLGEGENVKVLGEEDEIKNPVFKSENFQIKQVTFGGDVTIPLDDSQGRGLLIDDVTSELLTTRDQEETKLIVSWKTNKPALTELVFGKDLSQGGETIEEDYYGFSHSAVLSGLDYSSAYSYKIQAKDRWENDFDSKEFAFYTGAQKVSLIDLLFGAFSDVFSWAI